jgi:hypothetical protein
MFSQLLKIGKKNLFIFWLSFTSSWTQTQLIFRVKVEQTPQLKTLDLNFKSPKLRKKRNFFKNLTFYNIQFSESCHFRVCLYLLLRMSNITGRVGEIKWCCDIIWITIWPGCKTDRNCFKQVTLATMVCLFYKT